MKHYLVTSSFPGCLAETGTVVNTLRDASAAVARIIDDYTDGHKYLWENGERIENEDFEVEEERHHRIKKILTGARIRYAAYGGGVVVEVNEVDAHTARGWSRE